jgi:hypothetical protein
MKKALASGAVIIFCALSIAAEPIASADPGTATGRVVVFSTELQELDIVENPDGCRRLPDAAHVLINETDQVVTTYGDPLCMTPSLPVQPGYGAHVAPGTGSFSVGA